MRKGLKKTLKVSLAVLASVLGLFLAAVAVVLWFVLTPSRLTPLVEEASARYLDAEVRAGKVDVTLFSTFPRLTLRIDDGELVVRNMNDSVRAALPHRDSLLRFARCRVTFDPVAYLRHRRLVIHRLLLDSASVYAWRDADGRANWNFIPSEKKGAEDTAAQAHTAQNGAGIEAVVLRSLRIRDADIVYNDRTTDVYARVHGVNTRMRMGAGSRGAAANLDFSCKDVLLRQQGNLLLRRTALSLNTSVGFNADSMKVVLRNADLGINDVHLALSGTVRRDTVRKAAAMDLSIAAVAPSVEKALALIPESVVRHRDLTADGKVMLEGGVRGYYGSGLLPEVSFCLKIEEASARYEGLPYGIDRLNADFDAFVDLMREKDSYLDLKIFQLQGNDMDVLADAKVTDLFIDPLIVLNTKAKMDLGSISKIFPLQDGISLSGRVDADLRIRTRLSTVRNQDFGRIFAAGLLDMEDVSVRDTSRGLDVSGDMGLKFFGAKALGVDGEVSRLHFSSPRAKAVADSVRLRVISARPGDTSNVFRMKADITMNRLGALAGDSLNVFLGKGGVTASLGPNPERKNRPRIEAEVDTDSLFVRYGDIRGGLNKGQVSVLADKLRDSLWRPSVTVAFNRLRGGTGDSLGVYCLKGALDAALKPRGSERKQPRLNVNLEADSVYAVMGDIAGGMKKGVVRLQADKVRDSLWLPSGTLRFNRLVADLPQCALPVRVNRTVVSFGDRQISLEKAVVRVGRSNVTLSGTVHGLYGALKYGRLLRADLDISSRNLNLNQLMRAFAAPEASEQEVEADTVSSSLRLFEVPGNLSIDLTADVDRLRFGKYVFSDIAGKAELKNSHIYLENLTLNALDKASLSASLIYKAASSKFGYAGFDFKVHDIDIASLVEATPAIDSLVPMLQSFKGKVQMDVAAEGVLDSLLNIKIPSLRAAVHIRGDSLVLMDGKTFAEISKKLMFRNKEENLIDSISVNITVEDGSVNIYPFMVEIDRYQAAAGGVQNLDMSFDYHISILKSPLPFKAGLNIRGVPGDMRFGIGRAKYKDAVTPVATRKVDSARLNLSQDITRRFRLASERGRWGDRASRRSRIDWDERRDSVRRHRRIAFEGDSIQWEKVAPQPPSDPGGR